MSWQDSIEHQEYKEQLLSAKLVAEYSASDINRGIGMLAENAGIQINLTAKFPVNVYQISYISTGINRHKLQLSGLLAIPHDSATNLHPLLSLQHGTLFLHELAPSLCFMPHEVRVITASMGYITAAPDYIGYGESAHLFHPYVHAETLASATIDMIRACREFLCKEKRKTNGQLFLAGYSEGAYATLAAQKSMQEDFADEFDVTASCLGDGPYCVSKTATELARSDKLEYPAYIGFIIKAYDSIYSLNRLSKIFRAEYVEIINHCYDGKHSGDEINELLSHAPDELFRQDFLAAFVTGKEQKLTQSMMANDIFDWTPVAPTRFFHGRDDGIVPYHNAADTVKVMQDNGAKDVALVECDAGGKITDHKNCSLPYLAFSGKFFAGFAEPGFLG
jgi:pimeloyl-ACP methyl ester carboxylesterase